jgi:hypothetical protein
MGQPGVREGKAHRRQVMPTGLLAGAQKAKNLGRRSQRFFLFFLAAFFVAAFFLFTGFLFFAVWPGPRAFFERSGYRFASRKRVKTKV